MGTVSLSPWGYSEDKQVTSSVILDKFPDRWGEKTILYHCSIPEQAGVVQASSGSWGSGC